MKAYLQKDDMRQTVFLAYSVGDSSVSVFFTELAKRLSEDYLVIIFSDKRRPLSFDSEFVKLLYWPSVRPTKWQDFVFLRKQIKTYQPKLMLSTFVANNLFLVGGYLKRVPHRIATHRTISSHFKTSSLKKFRKKKVLGLATNIITNSQATKEDVMATFRVAAEKIKVSYNAVVNPAIEETRDPNLIVYAGRLTTNKGIDVLLSAFSELKETQPKLRLKVLGGTPDAVHKYKTEAETLSITDRVSFLGSIPRDKMLKEFATARYVVVPSLSEAFGFVVIEAFSVRTPVIGSNTGGIKEIIRDGKDGLLVEAGNVDQLAKAMMAMNHDTELVSKMGENAFQRFLDTFELQQVVDQLYRYLSNKISD